MDEPTSMNPLDQSLRNRLESTIVDARDRAEQAARAALEELGVDAAAPHSHLSEPQKDLRRRLRLHGRQLGDPLNGGKEQTIDRLVEEVAYEHWHRMLFARFLADNELLMYPDPGGPVPVSLQDCEELAADEGAANGWELAARYATEMLPQIFRVDSPVFELKLPANFQRPLERLLAELPTAVFTASDALGWVYQFWQTNNKKRINQAEVKIGARELPAVTQLFTEPYMVQFLLDNGVGAWWSARRLSENDLRDAPDEDTLRRKASIPGVPLDYLRFVHDTDEHGEPLWQPAAGHFPGWPENLADLKVVDPCCGSGHFLVSLLLMLVPMRQELEGLDARTAVEAVLRDNLHGLELDQRCVELAAFALALTAWRYPGAGGYRRLPEIQVACSGLSVSVAKEEWKQLGLGRRNLAIALDWLHDAFRDAPVLGSLLDPTRTEAAKVVDWSELSSSVERALEQENTDAKQEAAVVAHGLAKAATLLAGRYDWVVTNVPYLQRGKQSERLRDFCEKYYTAAKNELATVFLDRCLELCREGGTSSVVLPQSWLFLSTYRKFREKLLKSERWNLLARMGPGAFETITGEVVKAILLTLTHSKPSDANDGLFAGDSLDQVIRGVDVSESKTAADKAAALLSAEVKSVEQAQHLENPDFTIKIELSTRSGLVRDYASCHQGLTTGDDPRLKRRFWENLQMHSWVRMQGPSQSKGIYAGRETLVYDKVASGELRVGAFRGREIWGRNGIAVDRVTSLSPSLYTGNVFHSLVPVLIPKTHDDLSAIVAFGASNTLHEVARAYNQSLSIDNGYFEKLELDIDYWREQGFAQYPHGIPRPYCDDPTQWIFHGHPWGSVIWDETEKWTAHGPLRTDDTVLHVAVARLLGYRWPAELDPDMELAAEQREWVNRCEALLPHADEDGIVCIPAVRGEAPAEERLRDLLAAAHGEQWSPQVQAELLKSVDQPGRTLETWLRDKFFEQHCKLFQHRPFIWHIWDGLRDGFSALVNYHQLDHKNLETLIYTYVGDWISRQKKDIDKGVDGARERLAAAELLKERLQLILEGEAPYDIFVRWKPLAEQPIGWNPDLNDGVRLNIRPFMTVPDIKKKGAGVLREKPNINWKKDRGKDVASAPWYEAFGGERINDHHLRLADKQAARDGAATNG